MIRVLRVLEYTYERPEQAEQNMALWYVPANGTKALGNGCVIRSSVIIDLNSKKETLASK